MKNYQLQGNCPLFVTSSFYLLQLNVTSQTQSYQWIQMFVT